VCEEKEQLTVTLVKRVNLKASPPGLCFPSLFKGNFVKGKDENKNTIRGY
jgi:hypothetical protein